MFHVEPWPEKGGLTNLVLPSGIAKLSPQTPQIVPQKAPSAKSMREPHKSLEEIGLRTWVIRSEDQRQGPVSSTPKGLWPGSKFFANYHFSAWNRRFSSAQVQDGHVHRSILPTFC